MKITRHVRPPRGLTRLLYRAPIWLYRARCGWLLGERILLLHHTGRVTGTPRRAVLEVVEHDGQTDSYVVASGWGSSAAWYRNVLQSPEATIDVGRRRGMAVTALPLARDEGAELFTRHALRHRFAATQLLPRVLGFTVDGSAADFEAVGRHLPFVRFVPRIPPA